MDFEFSPEQRAFAEEVERFLDEHDDPEIFDLTRENMAQIVDTPKRRAFMREVGLINPPFGKMIMFDRLRDSHSCAAQSAFS